MCNQDYMGRTDPETYKVVQEAKVHNKRRLMRRKYCDPVE